MQIYKEQLARSRAGFTLLELLVVVSIVAFLATISLVALGVAQAKARDSKRQVDAFSIIKAAELHYSDHGFYPPYYLGLGLDWRNGDVLATQRSHFLEWLMPVAHAVKKFSTTPGDDGGGGGPCPTYKVCQGLACVSKSSCDGQPSGGACSKADDCQPAVAHEDLYIRDDCQSGTEGGCWLFGLDPYLSLVPIDPGHHQISDYDHYYISSHPEIVGAHGLCFFWSGERSVNDIAARYSDMTTNSAPIKGDPNWSVLCVR